LHNFRPKRYQKEFDYSYAFGVFAALELLTHRPGDTIKIIVSEKGNQNEGVRKLRERCADLRIPVEVADAVLDRISPKESHLAAGVFRKYDAPPSPGLNHVVLANISDMGNLGTILRTMLGFGVEDIALIRPAADIFDPRAVRASMGALFQARFGYFDSFEAYRSTYPAHGLYPLMTSAARPIRSVTFEPPFALVFGSESAGLPDGFLEIGTSISIPQTERIDSLNLAIAVGIALYEATTGHNYD
jgi:TrmH family RNA methyltransferase